MSINIDSIVVNKFKKIDDMEVELGQITLLVGANNSGKSSFLQGIQFAISALQSISISKDAKNKVPK